jgi:hypothetical protein
MTYSLLVLAALAVAGIGCFLRRRSNLLGSCLIGIGCVGCVAVIGWQVRQTLFPASMHVASRAHRVVGFCLASLIQREIAGRQGTVLLLLPPKSALDGETAETYANSLRGPLLRGHPELEVQVATLDAPAKEAKAGTISLAAFKSVMLKSPGALAFVSYAGVPANFGTLFPSDGPASAPVFVFDAGGTTNWVQPLVQHRIRSVIVPRPDADPAKASGLPGEIFGQLYYLATAENAAEVAAKLASSPAGSTR